MAGPPPSDAEGRRVWFREVFTEECAWVWRSLRRLGVHDSDLEDVAHEVFLTFYSLLDRYDPARPLRPWLFAIAVRVASDYRKRAFRRREILDSSVDAPAPTTVENAAEASEARAIVGAALGKLDDDRKAVFVMHDIDGIDMPTITSGLGIPLNTGYSRLRLARRDFAAAVEELRRPRVKAP